MDLKSCGLEVTPKVYSIILIFRTVNFNLLISANFIESWLKLKEFKAALSYSDVIIKIFIVMKPKYVGQNSSERKIH